MRKASQKSWFNGLLSLLFALLLFFNANATGNNPSIQVQAKRIVKH